MSLWSGDERHRPLRHSRWFVGTSTELLDTTRFKSGRRLQILLMFLGFWSTLAGAIASSITKNITIRPQNVTLALLT
jgi:hypothetical protein